MVAFELKVRIKSEERKRQSRFGDKRDRSRNFLNDEPDEEKEGIRFLRINEKI